MTEQDIFQRRKLEPDKLLAYCFLPGEKGYVLTRPHFVEDLTLTVQISPGGAVTTQVADDQGEEYVLHRVPGAVGSFVGTVRDAYEGILKDIALRCGRVRVFHTRQAEELTDFVSAVYGDRLEYLWEKFPDNAVWRRQDTGKWYAAILTVAGTKLGLATREKVEVIDLRMEPGADFIDNLRYFPGYHMNKKSWYTIVLDYTVETEEICRRIRASHRLAVK